jgi:hypothetical protein
MRLGSLMSSKEDSLSQQELMASLQQQQLHAQLNGIKDIHESKRSNGGIFTDFGEYPKYTATPYQAPQLEKDLLIKCEKGRKWSAKLPKAHGSQAGFAAGKRPNQRLVNKNGECNVTRANINKRRQRYMADIFTTLVDIKWRWNLLNFVLAFILSWMIFALTWWLICFSHGDLDSYEDKLNTDRKPCIEEVGFRVRIRVRVRERAS